MPDLLPLGDDRPRDAWTWVYRCVNLIAVLAILYAVGWAKGEFVSKDDYKHDQEAATAQRDKVLEADQKMLNELTKIDGKMENYQDHETRIRDLEKYVWRKGQ
jgi:hypothetical protein